MSEPKEVEYPVMNRLEPLRPQAEKLATLEVTLREWLDEKKEQFAELSRQAEDYTEAEEFHKALMVVVRLGEMATTIGNLERALGIVDDH